MTCPKCGAEYRQGYTSCADCHVFLVSGQAGGSQLARVQWVEGNPEAEASGAAGDTRYDYPGAGGVPAEPGDPNEDPFCSFWKGTDARVCAELCTVLDEAGIPHKTIHRQDHLFNFVMNSLTLFQLLLFLLQLLIGYTYILGEHCITIAHENSK